MSDKERILLMLVKRIYHIALYDRRQLEKWRQMQDVLDNSKLHAGDLVVAFTSFRPNDFLVGFVKEILPQYVVIREIGSERLCNYGNEAFLRIDKSILGYEILEGVEYETYIKALKAFGNSTHGYTVRFSSINFHERNCILGAREVFSDEEIFSITFPYSKKTSIRMITQLIDAEYRRYTEHMQSTSNEQLE